MNPSPAGYLGAHGGKWPRHGRPDRPCTDSAHDSARVEPRGLTHARDTAIHFFLQLAVILMACRLAGLAARRIGQPQVVGEMIAGVILGPSLLGRIAPDLQSLLFPPGITNVVLYTTAQIGLVLYMFIIGLNFDVNHVKQRAGTAAAVSATGTFAPLALGGVAAIPLLAHADSSETASASAWR